jgi:hypothetical protein
VYLESRFVYAKLPYEEWGFYAAQSLDGRDQLAYTDLCEQEEDRVSWEQLLTLLQNLAAHSEYSPLRKREYALDFDMVVVVCEGKKAGDKPYHLAFAIEALESLLDQPPTPLPDPWRSHYLSSPTRLHEVSGQARQKCVAPC